MERMLAVVFDSKAKAYEGSDALDGLEENSVIAYEQEVATLEADIARMKAKHAASRAERKGRLQARVDSLHEKLRHALDRAKAERDAIKREDAAKVQ